MVDGKEIKMSFTVALIGECMIELQEVEPGKTQQTFGGDTLNAAIYMARLGGYFPVRVDYVTALGCDSFSDRMVEFWELEGVGSSLVLREKDEMPGLYYIQLDEDGERHFSYWRGESAAKKNFEYQGGQEVLDRLGEYDAVYLSGISIAILTPASRERLFKRLAQLAASGIKICLDYNYRPHLWKSNVEGRKAYDAILPYCDTVFVGIDELVAIHAVSSRAAGHNYLAEKGVKESVIRSGCEPCSIQACGQNFEVAAETVTKVLDTTAAGDSFSAAYIVARNSDCDVSKAARIAHRMAAYVIVHKGAIAPVSAMPVFDDILEQK